jgi:hypothetical protein
VREEAAALFFGVASSLGFTDRNSSAPYGAINARHVILTATRERVRPL